MYWADYYIFGLITIICWTIGMIIIVISNKKKTLERPGRIIILFGIMNIFIFIILLWFRLERPPLRTLGETRLWYAFFLPAIGFITYMRWKYKWFLGYALGLSAIFLCINYLHPETYEKTLMPALQSPWFIPHVIVYLFAYALLAASSLVAVKGLYDLYFKTFEITTIKLADNFVYTGFSFLTFGLLFGALWAKTAWGHYWSWDPKETWALLTWLCYLLYIHIRFFQPRNTKTALWLLSLAFLVLLLCWFGINYLPSAQESIHVYSSNL